MMNLKSGSFYIPKANQGQDDHFICDEKNTIGVADGVGGWIKHGIDSGIYARELMSNSVWEIKNGCSTSVNPEEVLSEAYSKTKAEGASTACIITLKDNNVVHAVNVGDSGFMIIRRGKAVYKSHVQQRGFNCPYQLGNSKKSNRPTSAEVIQFRVEIGDVIVAGTDGLADNVFVEDIEYAVSCCLGARMEPQEVASKLAEIAFLNSRNAHFMSPFHLASAGAGHHHQGGKIDDITVIVSFVMHSSDVYEHEDSSCYMDID